MASEGNVYIKSNDGATTLGSVLSLMGTITVTITSSTSIHIEGAKGGEGTVTLSLPILGLTATQGSSTVQYAVGTSFNPTSSATSTYYVINQTETYKKLTYDSNKVQVESAIRDGNGVKIDTNYALKTYVDDAIEALPEPMLYKGTLGTGGTITSLPTAAAGNEGWVYKVITAGTYASQAAKIGDLFICANTSTTSTPSYAWTYVPSGDEPSGTVTNVATGAELTGGPITTTGTISHATSGVTAGTYQSVTVNTYGHVTAGSNPLSSTQVPITEVD